MGQRGPAPLPDNVRTLRGEPESKPRRQVRAVAAIPEPPAWLPAEGKAEWRRVTPELHRLGVLAKLDRALLTLYCDAWAQFVVASRLISTQGLLAAGQRGEDRKHPAWQIYRDAASTCSALAKELLLTPNARLRATMPEADDGVRSTVLD